MVDFLLILIILMASAITFNLQARHRVRTRREATRLRRSEELLRGQSDRAVDHTIDLIGEEEFQRMTERVNLILRRHGHQPCIRLNLTCGPDTPAGADELHHILPGMPLQLTLCSEGGVDWIDVYFNGPRIGRLALMESMILRDAMRSNYVRGAYVAEQNCFGIEDSHLLSIIVFLEKKENISLPGRETATGQEAIYDSLN